MPLSSGRVQISGYAIWINPPRKLLSELLPSGTRENIIYATYQNSINKITYYFNFTSTLNTGTPISDEAGM